MGIQERPLIDAYNLPGLFIHGLAMIIGDKYKRNPFVLIYMGDKC